jgi:hypothetical protein
LFPENLKHLEGAGLNGVDAALGNVLELADNAGAKCWSLETENNLLASGNGEVALPDAQEACGREECLSLLACPNFTCNKLLLLE